MVKGGAHSPGTRTKGATKEAPPPAAKRRGEGKDKGSPKKAKKAPALLPSPLRDDLMTPPSRQQLYKEYHESSKEISLYPHCVIKDILDPKRFDAMREEMIANLSSTFKETDLYKVYQTGDLGNLDPNDPDVVSTLPELMSLRQTLYSQEFRDFISEITGCGPLSERTDCCSNLHGHSCHLLCHDDVIGKRKVSWIFYMTDPEEEWKEEDGGALELYPLAEKGKLGVPATTPAKSVLPLPNSMAFFTVMPGESFHAVQEVFSQDKMRLSIQGWFHAPDGPQGAELATLAQLQTKEESTSIPFHPVPSASNSLTEEDLTLLQKWVNRAYLSAPSWVQILAKFQQDESILLHDFLLPEACRTIIEGSRKADDEDKVGQGRRPEYESGCHDGWKVVGPSHKQRYLSFTKGGKCGVGKAMAQLQADLVESGAFGRLLHKLTGLTPTEMRTEVRRFRPGLDYTVAHYGLLTDEPRLDASITFVKDELEDNHELWHSGDVGGFECYIQADEKGDATEVAESYRSYDNHGDDILSVFAKSNALSLVLRKKSLMRFIKYVSAGAPGSRWDVCGEFRVQS